MQVASLGSLWLQLTIDDAVCCVGDLLHCLLDCLALILVEGRDVDVHIDVHILDYLLSCLTVSF